MPPRIAIKATYAPNAKAWTTRPTINGVRYFLGYWPTDTQAVRMANQFKNRAVRETHEELIQSAEELREMARHEMQILRDDKKPDTEPQLSVAQHVEAIYKRLERLEDFMKPKD